MSNSPIGGSSEQEAGKTMFSFIQNIPFKGLVSLVLAGAGLASMFVGVILLVWRKFSRSCFCAVWRSKTGFHWRF